MKSLIFSVLVFLLNSPAFAKVECTFTRHQHIEVLGKDVSKELRNKILNDFNPDTVFVQKKNEEMALTVCGTLRPFHDLKDLSVVKPNEEHFLTKATLSIDPKGYWNLSLESFIRKGEKDTVAVTGIQTFTSLKKVKEIKNADIVEWVSSKLLILAGK